MNTKNYAEEKGLIQILTLITIGIIGFCIIWPLWNRTKSAYENLQKTKVIEEKLSDNIEKLNKQKKLLKEYELEIGRIPLAIPEKANEDQFIKIAQFAGGKSAITISKIDFEYAKEKVSFDMAVEGSYANILKFIEMINLAPRIIHVETVTMAKSKEESFTGLVISSIKGKFFILPKQKEPENGDNKQ